MSRKGLYELCLVCAGLLIYFFIRGAVANELHEAMAHSHAIIHLEQQLGIFREPSLQRLLAKNVVEIQFWDLVYFWGHAPAIAVVAVWLYRFRRPQYSIIRNAFLVSAVIGLLIYATYPVAPPRLISGFGFVDTMQRYSSVSYQAQSMKPFVNPFAAVPSLHFGWSFLIAVGLAMAIRNPLRWVLVVLLPSLMFLTVVATANHFFFDIVSGFVVCLGGLGASLAFQHWQTARAGLVPSTLAEAVEPLQV